MRGAIDEAAERAMRAYELEEGRAVRVWSTLPEVVRESWRAAVRAVLDPSAPTGALTRARAPRELVDELEAESADGADDEAA